MAATMFGFLILVKDFLCPFFTLSSAVWKVRDAAILYIVMLMVQVRPSAGHTFGFIFFFSSSLRPLPRALRMHIARPHPATQQCRWRRMDYLRSSKMLKQLNC
jgi:hypothetical protein